MSRNDKIAVLATIVLAIIFLSKSLYFDEVKNLKGDELKFKQFVEKSVDEEHQGFLDQKDLIVYHVVELEKTSDKGSSTIEYYDENTKEYKTGEIKGKYKAKVRGYFLKIMPYKEFYVTTPEKK